MRWTCSRCGREHEGLPLDWAHDEPAYWDGGRAEDDFVSDDLCIWTDDDGETAFFIRGVLPIPVHQTGEVFHYGVWSSLSRRSYDRILELWDDEAREGEPPYFGYLSNQIPGYPDTLGLHLAVVTGALKRRPTFVLLSGTEHPLVDEQWQGIDSARVQEIAELNMH